jgi:hypothetical protein
MKTILLQEGLLYQVDAKGNNFTRNLIQENIIRENYQR